MSSTDNHHQSSLAGMLGQSSCNEDEIKTLRCKAWREQGVLNVTAWDRRLSRSEAKLVCEIGERLYGGD